MRIGLDLDNTLIDYSPAFGKIASQLGHDKKLGAGEIRNSLRSGNDEEWQLLQSHLYTDGLAFAILAEKSLEFLALAKKLGSEIVIVSHKTPTTPLRFGSRDLHAPALNWLRQNKVVPRLVSPENVHLCPTRDAKILKIAEAELDWFVDDLPEVLNHPGFPKHTVGWLFAGGYRELAAKTRGQEPDNQSRSVRFSDLSEILERRLDLC